MRRTTLRSGSARRSLVLVILTQPALVGAHCTAPRTARRSHRNPTQRSRIVIEPDPAITHRHRGQSGTTPAHGRFMPEPGNLPRWRGSESVIGEDHVLPGP